MGTKQRYRETSSETGTFSPKLKAEVVTRICEYCKKHDMSKTEFVEHCVLKELVRLETQELMDMDKVKLVEMIMQERIKEVTE